MDRTADGAKVHFPPPLVYLAGLALGVALDRLLHLPTLGFGRQFGDVVGGLFLLGGALVDIAGAGLFLRRRTAIIPFKPASCLVTSGIYAWTRNPMYLGMAFIYAGIALILDSLAALVMLPVVLAIIQLQVIAREEAYLERAFGTRYAAYKSRVRRWI